MIKEFALLHVRFRENERIWIDILNLENTYLLFTIIFYIFYEEKIINIFSTP